MTKTSGTALATTLPSTAKAGRLAAVKSHPTRHLRKPPLRGSRTSSTMSLHWRSKATSRATSPTKPIWQTKRHFKRPTMRNSRPSTRKTATNTTRCVMSKPRRLPIPWARSARTLRRAMSGSGRLWPPSSRLLSTTQRRKPSRTNSSSTRRSSRMRCTTTTSA